MISPHGSCKFGDTRRCLDCLGRGAVSVGTHWLALGLRGVLGLEELSYSSDWPFPSLLAGISQSPSGRPVLPSRGEDSLCQPKLNELVKTPRGAFEKPGPFAGIFTPFAIAAFRPRRATRSVPVANLPIPRESGREVGLSPGRTCPGGLSHTSPGHHGANNSRCTPR